jgi:hypothetical protein
MVKTARAAAFAVLVGFAAGVGLFGTVPSAWAVSTSDKGAAILVWPKIVVDTTGRFTEGTSTDTLIQLSNLSTNTLKEAYCFYINGNSHCQNNPSAVCFDASDCPSGLGYSPCVPGWSEIDFTVLITADQPLAWYASEGLQRGDFPLEGFGHCSTPPGRLCTRDSDCGFPNGQCILGQNNSGSGIPPVPEDPFFGTLKCIQFDPGVNPPVPDQSATTNALKGEATVLSVQPLDTEVDTYEDAIDAAAYNAVGLRATGVTTAPTNELRIGGDPATAEYQACPNTLVLDHLFDFATDPISVNSPSPNGEVVTDLTLVPCGDDFLRQIPGRVTAQFLVFNEFEQRFSTSRTVDCFYESVLSNIDTSNNIRSIFSAFVSGTIAGQTRIRGVGSAPTGRGLLGSAFLFAHNDETDGFSAAGYNLHQQGNPPAGTAPDIIVLP